MPKLMRPSAAYENLTLEQAKLEIDFWEGLWEKTSNNYMLLQSKQYDYDILVNQMHTALLMCQAYIDYVHRHNLILHVEADGMPPTTAVIEHTLEKFNFITKKG